MLTQKIDFLRDKYREIFWWRQSLRQAFDPDEVQGLPRSWYFKSKKDQLIGLHREYLISSGWLESIQNMKPTFKGKPIPWFTYPSLFFIESLDIKNLKYLEIGGGFSTLYFAQRGVVGKTYEFDSDWGQQIEFALRGYCPKSDFEIEFGTRQVLGGLQGSPLFNSLSADQQKSLREFMSHLGVSQEESLAQFLEQGEMLNPLVEELPKVDILVIDGNFRNLICMLATKFCRDTTTIILDNSDRPEYALGISELEKHGWVEIPFHGLGPMNSYAWTTSIWLKELVSSHRNKLE